MRSITYVEPKVNGERIKYMRYGDTVLLSKTEAGLNPVSTVKREACR